MKKIILFLLIIFIPNVYADMCKYNINNTDYSLYYEVNYNASNWVNAYSFGNNKKSIELIYTNGSNSGTGITVSSGSENKLFRGFFKFGSFQQTGACPVLVSIGLNKYVTMPYDVYNEFFAVSNTLKCDSCNDDLIQAKSYTGSISKYTFEDVCKYINENRRLNYHGTHATKPEYVPLLGYFYLNENYSNQAVIYNNRMISSSGITAVCKTYKEKSDKSSGLPDGITLGQMLSRYEDDFVIGEVDGFADALNVCPLNDGKNKMSDILSCLEEKGKSIDDAVENFKDKCSEREMRAIQSYSSGTTASFYDRAGVSPYLDKEIKMPFNSFSSECGEASDNLYSNINNLNRVLYSYSNDDEIRNKLAYMYVQSKYLIGYGILTSVNSTTKVVDDACSLITPAIKNIIKEVLNAFKISIVILVIFLSIIEIYKAMASGDDKVKKKMPSLIAKRIIILCITLLLPSLILLLIDILNKYIPVDTSKCVINEIKE